LSIKSVLEILLGSLIPFGTFYIERKYLKNELKKLEH
jgi:hypothetical protein